MATTYTEKDVARVETTGSLVEAAGGIAVVVLSIISLAGAGGMTLPSIAVIILGAAMLAEGGTVVTEFSRLLSMATADAPSSVEAGGGMTSEIVVGAGVLVLGVLALIGIASATLIAVAVIATGGMMLLTAASVHRLNEIRVQMSGSADNARGMLLAAGAETAAFKVLVAIAAIVLGIVALSAGAFYPITRSTVGLLILGGAIALSGTALTSHLTRYVKR